MTAANAINVVLGVVVLAFGRRLYWLFVGVTGFLLGAEFAAIALSDQPQWVATLIAVVAGLIGAVLAVGLQRVAFALAGLLAGGYLAIALAQNMGWHDYAAIIAAVGAVAGCLLAIILTDQAIIALSCLAGAAAIVAEFGLSPVTEVACFLVLAILGAVYQDRDLRRHGKLKQQPRSAG